MIGGGAEKNVVSSLVAGWISTGGTGAPNYDEFVSDAEITAVIAAHPDSVLGVEMPHSLPGSSAASLTEALPAAAERWARLQATRFRSFEDAVALYEIRTSTGVSRGLFAMVATAEVSTAENPGGRVVRNEEVFAAKVADRAALLQTLQAQLSPVLLIQADHGPELDTALADSTRDTPPDLVDIDEHGHRHAVWLQGTGPERDRLLRLAGGGELVVADGNHRSLAAVQAESPRFLAVIAPPQALTIAPYQRLIRRLPVPAPELLAALEKSGAEVEVVSGSPTPPSPGQVGLCLADRRYRVTLPRSEGGPADRIDHAVVERLLLRGALGLDPGSPEVIYVGGDYPDSWLVGEVESGRADLAILLAPVSVAEFLAVNKARETMPRKSTWFVPKARTGLIVADLAVGEDETRMTGPA